MIGEGCWGCVFGRFAGWKVRVLGGYVMGGIQGSCGNVWDG